MDIKTSNGWISLNPTDYETETRTFWQREHDIKADRFESNLTDLLVIKPGTSTHEFRATRNLTAAEKAQSRSIRKGR